MSETNAAAPQKGVIAQAGAPERGSFPSQKQKEETGTGAGTTDAATETVEEKNARELLESQATKTNLPEITDDQLKEIFAKKGIEGFDGNFAALKEKLEKADKASTATPSEEEKKLAEAAFENRMLNFHIENGGTAEQFVALKQIASMDLKELSIAEIKKEMKENGFDDGEIDVVLKERYFQLNPDELKRGEDESEEEFNKRQELTKKKVTYGSKKLEARSTHTKQNAEALLNNLRDAIKAQDLEKQTEAEFSSKVDEMSKKVSRKVTFELGEVNKAKIDPVLYDVSEADVAEVVSILKDPKQRQQYFFNEDKTLNLTKVMDVMLRNKYLESLAKATYLEGGDRQVAIFRKTFPGTPTALGVGGAIASNNNGRAGVIKSAGQPEVVAPQHKL